MSEVPSSPEAEAAVLGSIIYNPGAIIAVRELLKPDDFHIVRNGIIYAEMLEIFKEGDVIDEVTLVHRLRQRRPPAISFEDLGGSAYITSLVNSVPSHHRIESYARIVEATAIRRRLLDVASEIAELAYDSKHPLLEVVNQAEERLLAITRNVTAITESGRTSGELMAEYFSTIEERFNAGGKLPGFTTGFNDIDAMLGGMKRGHYHLLGGRPGMMKTSYMLNAALNAMRYDRARVAFFSLEMIYEQVAERLMLLSQNIPGWKLQYGKLDDREWSLFVDGVSETSRLPLRVFNINKAITTADDVVQLARYAAREDGGLDIIMVDYIQLMGSEDDAESSKRQRQLMEINRRFKLFANEMNAHVLVAAQLNRKVEERADKRPQLADLKDAGLEADADAVMFLYRDEYYNASTLTPNVAEVKIAKHRHGATGTKELFVNKERMMFANLEKQKIPLNGFEHPTWTDR